MYGKNESNAIIHSISDLLDEFITPYAIFNYLRAAIAQIEQIRRDVFDNMKHSGRSRRNISDLDSTSDIFCQQIHPRRVMVVAEHT